MTNPTTAELFRKATAFSKERFVDIIHRWKSFWMNQTQNSKEDRENYFRRAIGVDANMKYHLVELLEAESSRRKPVDDTVERLIEVTERVHNQIGMDALQLDLEPGHLDPSQAVKTLEITIDVQKRWFTEFREALNELRTACEKLGAG